MDKNILMLILCASAFFACTNEEDFMESKMQKDQTFELVNLNDYLSSNSTLRSAIQQEDQIVIKFKDELAYESTIENIRTMSKDEQLAWSQTLGFNSLQRIYEQAMMDVDAVDETEVSYMAFKEKYDKYLYFPMHKEDMGFYMPIIEQDKAVVSSIEGLVIIGNEIRNLNDITSYADLQVTGQAYYSIDENVSTRAIPVGYNTKSDFIGKEIDSGWFEDSNHDRKLRIKIGRKSNKANINPIPPNPSNPYGTPGFAFGMNLKLEISFRKKTWLGWVNYSSETRTNMTFTIGGRNYPYTHNENGASSHDWTDAYPLPFNFTGQYLNAVKPIYFTPAIGASFNTYYRAFDTPDGTSTIRWSYQLPGEYFVEY